MSLWLALCIPALPLQRAQRVLTSAGAMVITEGPVQRPVVVFANPTAQTAGVTPGMKLVSAQALIQPLIALPRRPDDEQRALHELCCWAYQFSSQVAPFISGRASGVIIETAGSQRLFAGHDALHRRIRRGLSAMPDS